MAERYQREIEDILVKLEGPPAEESRTAKGKGAKGLAVLMRRLFSGRGRWLSPGRVMLTALAMLLVALLFKATLPGFIVPVLMWGAAMVFILGYSLFFINASERPERRWRGQSVEGPPSSWSRWRDWLRGSKK